MKEKLNTKLPTHLRKSLREKQFGVPKTEWVKLQAIPSDTTVSFHDKFITYKSAKKGQNSFRITKSLLESLLSKAKCLGKNPYLTITIEDDGETYKIECLITKKDN